jgi:hypothetical protein
MSANIFRDDLVIPACGGDDGASENWWNRFEDTAAARRVHSLANVGDT